jgi:hypothetical protein
VLSALLTELITAFVAVPSFCVNASESFAAVSAVAPSFAP